MKYVTVHTTYKPAEMNPPPPINLGHRRLGTELVFIADTVKYAIVGNLVKMTCLVLLHGTLLPILWQPPSLQLQDTFTDNTKIYVIEDRQSSSGGAMRKFSNLMNMFPQIPTNFSKAILDVNCSKDS
jgi:hypothetical protein